MYLEFIYCHPYIRPAPEWSISVRLHLIVYSDFCGPILKWPPSISCTHPLRYALFLRLQERFLYTSTKDYSQHICHFQECPHIYHSEILLNNLPLPRALFLPNDLWVSLRFSENTLWTNWVWIQRHRKLLYMGQNTYLCI